MFSTPFRALPDNYVYITMFKMDGLGLADHEHWGMSIKSTHLVLDYSLNYSQTLKRSWLHEEASVARCFYPLGWRVALPGPCRLLIGFEAKFMNEEEDNGKR